jgi:CBS domain-containing protein
MSLQVSKLMKQPVLVAAGDDYVATMQERMQRAGVRHLPVVDAQRRLIGVVSDRDLMRVAAAMETAEGKRETLRVCDVMQSEPLRATLALPAHEAAAMMIDHKIGMLPVVDDTGVVQGVVTATDFLEVAREALLGVDPSGRARA